MVSRGWCVVSKKICIRLKVVTPISIDKLNFLLLIRTIFSKSLITSQIVLFHTLKSLSFEHFLHINHPN